MITESRKKQLQGFLKQVNINPDNLSLALINSALTHPSFVFEKGPQFGPHNQRLEFLGDAVVGLMVGDYLYNNFLDKDEGELTKMRAVVVCESSLAQAAERLGLGTYLLMGKGERLGGGAKRPSNLADAFEALIGALYLELGLSKTSGLALKYIQPEIDKVGSGNYGDYKTQFQELVQREPGATVEYRILAETGPDHEKRFFSGVFLNDKLIAQGQGKTKKEAEQHAAHEALIKTEGLNK